MNRHEFEHEGKLLAAQGGEIQIKDGDLPGWRDLAYTDAGDVWRHRFGLEAAAREILRLAERVRTLESTFAHQADMRRAAPVIAQGIADREERLRELEGSYIVLGLENEALFIERSALKAAAARVLELVFGGDWNTGRPGDPLADAVTALRALLKE